jgi:hypothetical protein
MKRQLLLPAFLLLALAAAPPTRASPAGAAEGAAPAVFASPVNGGCYIAAQNECRLHLEPYTIYLGSGERLEAVRVQANGVTIYDYRTDVSNPPPQSGTTHTLSTVALDFAAVCGRTYTVNVLGKSRTDANFLNMGQVEGIACPATVP